MRSSLIVLAIVLASLRVVPAALARRVRRVVFVPGARRRGSALRLVSALSLPDDGTSRSGAAEGGKTRGGRGATPGDRRASRFIEWRYYGFSHHAAETDASAAEPPDVVASAPAVGSVVSILPDDCVTTVVNGRVYRQCGSVWYQRQYTGSNVSYLVVPAP